MSPFTQWGHIAFCSIRVHEAQDSAILYVLCKLLYVVRIVAGRTVAKECTVYFFDGPHLIVRCQLCIVAPEMTSVIFLIIVESVKTIEIYVATKGTPYGKHHIGQDIVRDLKVKRIGQIEIRLG